MKDSVVEAGFVSLPSLAPLLGCDIEDLVWNAKHNTFPSKTKIMSNRTYYSVDKQTVSSLLNGTIKLKDRPRRNATGVAAMIPKEQFDTLKQEVQDYKKKIDELEKRLNAHLTASGLHGSTQQPKSASSWGTP